MIEVTRINGTKLSINPYLVESIEETPDSIIVFNSGRKLVLKEKKAEIEQKFIEFLSQSIKLGIESAEK